MNDMWSIPITGGDMLVRHATPEDIPALLAISDDAGAREAAKGITTGGAPPRPLAEIFADRVAEGALYLALIEGEPAATVTLYTAPEALWADLPGDAVYVHGLAALRRFSGRGVGTALLDWAGDRAREQSIPLLRLDCDALNPRLRAYYEEAGFARRGDVQLPHRSAARYERHVQGGGQ